MRTCLAILLLVSTALASLAVEKPEAAKKQPPDPRFKNVPRHCVAAITGLEESSPKLVAAWLKVWEAHTESKRLVNVFGVRKRKEAERALKSLQSRLPRDMQSYRKLYAKVREPMVEEQAELKDRAFRLSQKKPATSESRRAADEQKVTKLYDEARMLGDRIETLNTLEHMVSRLTLPSRLEQLGISSHSPMHKEASRYEAMIEELLNVKDCLADIHEMKARESSSEWSSADSRMLTASQAALGKATSNLNKELDRILKPSRTEIAKSQKKIDSLKGKIEALTKRKRPTDKYDLELFELETQVRQLNASIEQITKLANIDRLKPKGAKKKKAPVKKKAPAKKPAH